LKFDTPLRHEPHYLLPARKSTVRGKIIHHIRQHAREFRDDLVAGKPRAAGQLVDDIPAERRGNLVRADVLVLAGTHPGIDHIAEPLLLELLDEAAEPIDDAAGDASVDCGASSGNLGASASGSSFFLPPK
jgi:hypothetical protein